MSIFKKKIMLLIVTMVILSLLVPANVFADINEQSSSPSHSLTFTEKIDNTNYQYTISENGSRSTVLIKNLDSKKTDTLILKNNIFYLNGKVVGKITELSQSDYLSSKYQPKARSSWKRIDNGHPKELTWKPGIGKVILAGMIGAAIGLRAGPIIAGGIGAALGYIATTGGATVYYKLYYRRVGRFSNYKAIWKLITKTNVSYRYYTTYMTI